MPHTLAVGSWKLEAKLLREPLCRHEPCPIHPRQLLSSLEDTRAERTYSKAVQHPGRRRPANQTGPEELQVHISNKQTKHDALTFRSRRKELPSHLRAGVKKSEHGGIKKITSSSRFTRDIDT